MSISDVQTVWAGVGIGGFLRETMRGIVDRESIARCAIAE
jgi:hypothetical protein